MWRIRVTVCRLSYDSDFHKRTSNSRAKGSSVSSWLNSNFDLKSDNQKGGIPLGMRLLWKRPETCPYFGKTNSKFRIIVTISLPGLGVLRRVSQSSTFPSEKPSDATFALLVWRNIPWILAKTTFHNHCQSTEPLPQHPTYEGTFFVCILIILIESEVISTLVEVWVTWESMLKWSSHRKLRRKQYLLPFLKTLIFKLF